MKVLIVKTSSLGDVVQTFPVVEYLRARQSVRKIGWIVEEKAFPLVQAHPGVDMAIGIHTQRLRSHRLPWNMLHDFYYQRQAIREDHWDIVFDLQGNTKSGIVTAFSKADVKVGYGFKSAPEWLNPLMTRQHFNPPKGLSIQEEYLWMVQSFFGDTIPFQPSSVHLRLNDQQRVTVDCELDRWPKNRPVWMVAMGSFWPNKKLAPSALSLLLQSIHDRFGGYFVFLAGSSGELHEVGILARSFPQSSHVLFQPPLPVLQQLVGHAHAVVAVDSLILYLAASTFVPTFSVFGPSSAKKFGPIGRQHYALQMPCPFAKTFSRRCSLLRTCPSGACLKNIDGQEIVDAHAHWHHTLFP